MNFSISLIKYVPTLMTLNLVLSKDSHPQEIKNIRESAE